jgi:hypothetical protein
VTDGGFWKVVEPARWPSAPDRLSHSSTLEIQTCARRWALAHGDYTNTLGIAEYPRRLRKRTIAGQVTHLALQRIADSLREAGCVGPQDSRVPVALRGLGGISGVLEGCRDDVLKTLDGNRRAEPYAEVLRDDLARRIPGLRQQVQGSLQRIFGSSEPPRGTSQPDGIRRDGALSYGFHTEVKLAPSDIPWIGWADAIKLGPGQCEIIDFKTGQEDESHWDQLRLYALLWARDSRLNPTGRLATHLTLVYPGSSRPVEVPTEADLTVLESELIAVGARVGATLQEVPPLPFVATDSCRFCDVKHLCAEYWQPSSRPKLREESPAVVRSVELDVGERRGARSWSVSVIFDPFIEAGAEAILIGSPHVSVRRGSRLRIIDCRVEIADQDVPLIHIGPTTELFVLEEG